MLSALQVKELGVLVTDCPCLAADMAKIFEVYWALGGEGKTVPTRYILLSFKLPLKT